ncbi:MAG: hypothetical protein Q8O89_08155 [Nanoarchaeota archaeon]|nr:hypothetical protein [Nanoarchaeota archaeon]
MRKVKSMFTLAGLLIILMTLVVAVSANLFPSYVQCQQIKSQLNLPPRFIDSADITMSQIMQCSSINADVYLSYLFFGLGFAILIASFIVSEEDILFSVKKENGKKKLHIKKIHYKKIKE